MNPMIQIRNLEVRKGDKPICAVSELDIAPGERLLVMGPNGAGKTTLLRVMAGLEKCDVGECKANIPGQDRVYVHQRPYLFRGTVAFNVGYGLKARGLPRQTRISESRDWMEIFGIRHLADRRIATLSGGERRRTALARAFVVKPKLLLLDEPFAELDEEGVNCMVRACESAEAAIVFASPLPVPSFRPSRTYNLAPAH